MKRNKYGLGAFTKGFTLVELLVVLTIILILAAMLLPVLANARAYSKRVVCMNNLKQIGAACFSYEADNGRMVDFLSWLYPRGSFTNGNLTKGLIFSYLRTKEIYLCPNDVDKLIVFPLIVSETSKIDHSYVINCYSCHAKNISQSLSPCKTVYFMEKTNLIPSNFNSLIALSQPNFNHKKKTNILKMDSHIATINMEEFNFICKDRYFWYPTGRIEGY